MSRELLIACDRCKFELNQRNAGSPRTLTVEDQEIVLDLCDDCEQALLGPVKIFAQEYGIPSSTVTPAAKNPTSKVTQSRPGRMTGPGARGSNSRTVGPKQALVGYPTTCLWCPAQIFNSQHSGEHLRSSHGAASAFDVWGHDCPLCGQSFQRLAMHGTSFHQMDMHDMVRAALKDGDQHGIADKIMKTVRKRRTA